LSFQPAGSADCFGTFTPARKRVMTTGRSDTGNRSPTHNTELQIFIGRKSLTVCKGHMQVTKCGLCNLLFYKL